MQRTSCSAGVQSARTMRCLHSITLRSFTICFIIVVITASPASGFAIRRIESSEPTSDLEAGESSLLEVKYDLKTPKSEAVNKTDADAFTTTQSTPTIHKVTINPYILLVTKTSVSPIINTSKIEQNETNSSTLQFNANDSTTVATSTLSINEETTNYNFLTTNSMSNEENHENKLSTTEFTPESFPNNNIETTVSSSITNLTIARSATNFSVTLTYNDDTTSQVSTTGYTFTSPSNDNKTLKSFETFHTEYETTLINFNADEPTKPVEGSALQFTSNYSDFTTNTDLNVATSQHAIVSEKAFKTTIGDVTTDMADINNSYLENNTLTTIESPITESLNTESVQADLITTLSPRVTESSVDSKITTTTSSKETLSPDLRMTRSETSRLILEEVLINTPIPSLIQLKNDLFNIQSQTTKTYGTEINVPISPKMETSSTHNISAVPKLQTEKIGIISSKRAGYLDNTETTNMKIQEATTINYASIEKATDTDTFASMYETEGNEGDTSDALEVKNVTGIESQSQLVEDAIKEELLMEKTLHENEYIKKKANQITVKPTLRTTPSNLNITSAQNEEITEDVLSVKPINTDKNQLDTLYSLSSNYKPLKKLEVQSTTQFIRDPDDNSWRNESISSLGIVFKPKNASKSFTEVLKSKTEELSNIADRNNKNIVPDLRVRLEKIAEVRKSKKKKMNIHGDIVYSDYEDGSVSNASLSNTTSLMTPQLKLNLSAVTNLSPITSTTHKDIMVNQIQKENFKMFKNEFSTQPPQIKNKLYRMGEYYDSSDDYDADYVTKLDLKKFTLTPKIETYTLSPQNVLINTKQSFLVTDMPDRQPTVQYFPPTKKIKIAVDPQVNQEVNINEYDEDFKNKFNQFSYSQPTESGYKVPFETASPVESKPLGHPGPQIVKPYNAKYIAEVMNKNLYLTSSSPEYNHMQGVFGLSNGNINKASYVIKHYKDFIADAVKHSGDDNLSFTVSPIQTVSMSDIDKLGMGKELKSVEDYNDNTEFRKEIVSRFVDNFNQNSDRYKADFPIIYNNSVVHKMVDDKGQVLASSRTTMKRLYNAASPRTNFFSNAKPCNANCESMRVVDLLPAYELHYYVPDQEEKEQIEPRQNVLPYRYKL